MSQQCAPKPYTYIRQGQRGCSQEDLRGIWVHSYKNYLGEPFSQLNPDPRHKKSPFLHSQSSQSRLVPKPSYKQGTKHFCSAFPWDSWPSNHSQGILSGFSSLQKAGVANTFLWSTEWICSPCSLSFFFTHRPIPKISQMLINSF